MLLKELNELSRKPLNMTDQNENLEVHFPEAHGRYIYDFTLVTIIEHEQRHLTCCAPSERNIGCYCTSSLDSKVIAVFETMVQNLKLLNWLTSEVSG